MKRTKNLGFKVSPYEEKLIRANARKSNMHFSNYARAALLGKEIVVIEGVAELHTQLRYIGNNLNQITVILRRGHIQNPNLESIKQDVGRILHLVETALQGEE